MVSWWGSGWSKSFSGIWMPPPLWYFAEMTDSESDSDHCREWCHQIFFITRMMHHPASSSCKIYFARRRTKEEWTNKPRTPAAKKKMAGGRLVGDVRTALPWIGSLHVASAVCPNSYLTWRHLELFLNAYLGLVSLSQNPWKNISITPQFAWMNGVRRHERFEPRHNWNCWFIIFLS